LVMENKAMTEPKSLQEAILYFADPANCREYLVARRWPDGVICPRCQSKNVLFLEKYNRWHCREKHTAPQFTLKTGTIFEDSPLGLDKWLTAMWMIVNCKNGISSWEIHRALKITQKSAWFMDHRIRLALQSGSLLKLGGPGSEVEVDETFIGGKARNMHKEKRIRMMHDRGNVTFIGRERPGNLPGKVAVHGMLDRESRKIRATVVFNIKRETLQKAVLDNVHASSTVYTDQATAYDNLRKHNYTHEVVNHLNDREFSEFKWIKLPLSESLDWIGGIEEIIRTVVTPKLLSDQRSG
jgi:transposase-like protein